MSASNSPLNRPAEWYEKKPVCLTNAIRNKIIAKFTKKYGLTVGSLDDSTPEGVVHLLGVGFNINHAISKQKVRQIVVECVQDFITAINNDEQLRPYLKEYPFTSKNIDVSLFASQPNGERVYYPDILGATAWGGNIWYMTKERNQEHGYKTEEKESFEEAVQRLKDDPPKEDFM